MLLSIVYIIIYIYNIYIGFAENNPLRELYYNGKYVIYKNILIPLSVLRYNDNNMGGKEEIALKWGNRGEKWEKEQIRTKAILESIRNSRLRFFDHINNFFNGTTPVDDNTFLRKLLKKYHVASKEEKKAFLEKSKFQSAKDMAKEAINWEIITDPKSGKIYYVNNITMELMYQTPKAILAQRKVEADQKKVEGILNKTNELLDQQFNTDNRRKLR